MLCFRTWRILGGGDYFGVVLKHSPVAQHDLVVTLAVFWVRPGRSAQIQRAHNSSFYRASC